MDPYKTLRHAAMYVQQFVPLYPEPMTEESDAEIWAIQIISAAAECVLQETEPDLVGEVSL